MDEPTLQDLLVDASVLSRADVGAVLVGLDHTRPFDLSAAFTRAAVAIEGTDLPLSRFYHLLALAFEPQLRPDQTRDPFGPMSILPTGERSLLPSDLTSGHLDLLQAATDDALHPAFNARLYDILWTCKHGRGQELPRNAASAVHAYLADAKLKQQGSDWPFAPRSLERALRLSHQFGRASGEGLSQDARDAAATLADAFEAARQWMGIAETRRLMHEFGVGDLVENAKACERSALAAEADGGQVAAERLWGQAVVCYQRAKNDAGLQSAIRQAAELAVRQSEARAADSAGVAVHFLEAAIKQLRRLPAATRAEREGQLLARLTELQARSLSEMKQISAPFDGRETWERAQIVVAGKSLFEALCAFVLHARPLEIATLRKQIETGAGQSVLMHLIPIKVTGDGGKTVKHIPTMDTDRPEERETAIRYHMVQHANMHQNLVGATYVEAARRVIAAEHRVSVSELILFMHRSGFVPVGREWQWAKAFAAGLDNDFTTATHLLVPQLEHAWREVLRGAGETTVTMDKYGQQEDWNLNHILLREGRLAAEAIVGEDTVFDLAALLVDRGGANLRNAVSHGFVDDGGLEGGLARHLFWACMRLCMFPLIAQVEETRRAKDQGGGER